MSFSSEIRKIEDINELDVDRLQKVAKASMEEMRKEVDNLNERHIYRIYKHFFERDELEKWMESGDFTVAKFYIAFEDGKIAGTLRYKIEQENEAELQALYVDPDYTGKGIATGLIERAHEDLEGNVRKVRADVFEGNEPSLQLLEEGESFEYHRDSVDEDVFDGLDAIIMRHKFDK